MTQVPIPKAPAELEEMLQDGNRMKPLFDAARAGDSEPFNEFMRNYGQAVLKKDTDIMAQLREQTQDVLAQMFRENGVNGSPKIDLAAIAKGSGSPQLNGSARSVSRGRGAVYNKMAPGAQLEQQVKPEDRFETMGEYCQAIFELRSPTTRDSHAELIRRLQNVRKFQNSFGSEEPGAGGFLIPELMRSQLLELALEEAIVRNRATVIPMSTLRVPIPSVDDTSHASSLFGGVVFYWTEEAASLTESQATFSKVVLDAKKLTGFFKVPAELLDDAPAFAGWFDARVPAGLAWFEDVAFFTGTGVGEPLGFLNCPAAVSVTAESGQLTKTLLWENIVKMYSRMLPTSHRNSVWIANNDTFPELATMALSVGTGGGPIWIGSYNGPSGVDNPPMTILGRPVIFTEKAPTLGTTGDISYVDLSYYLVGDRQQVRVDSSEHFLFQNNQIAFRLISRLDGRPWLQSALTPHQGTNTLSPFVQLATR